MSDHKKVLYLHIGAEKTGTTSVQRVFATHSVAIRNASGVYYPDRAPLCTNNAHYPVAAAFLRPNQIDFVSPKERLTPSEAMQALQQAAARTEHSALVLSAEHFSSRFEPAQIAALREALKTALSGYAIKVIYAVRSQPSMYCAAKSTCFRSGGTSWKEPHRIIRTDRYFNWAQTADDWAKEFGTENIRILNYHGSDAIDSFFSELGLDLTAKDFPDRQFENRSLSYEDIRTIEILSTHLGPVDVTDWEAFTGRIALVSDLLGHLGKFQMLRTPLTNSLSLSDYHHFLSEFGESNDRLQATFNLKFNLNDHIRSMIDRASDDATDSQVSELQSIHARLAKSEASRKLAEAQLKDVLKSTSWKVTGPMRTVGTWLKSA